MRPRLGKAEFCVGQATFIVRECGCDGDAGTVIWAVTPHRKLFATKVRLLLDHLVSGCGERPWWDEGLTDPLLGRESS